MTIIYATHIFRMASIRGMTNKELLRAHQAIVNTGFYVGRVCILMRRDIPHLQAMMHKRRIEIKREK